MDMKTVIDGLSSTVLGSEFQTAGDEYPKQHLERSVLKKD